MAYILKVRLASFFAGAATASFSGLYLLRLDYKLAYDSISQQMKRISKALDERVCTLENLNAVELSKHGEATK